MSMPKGGLVWPWRLHTCAGMHRRGINTLFKSIHNLESTYCVSCVTLSDVELVLYQTGAGGVVRFGFGASA